MREYKLISLIKMDTLWNKFISFQSIKIKKMLNYIN